MTTEIKKTSKKKRFDWSIVDHLDRRNIYLSYPTILEAKSYWPGTENIPKSLELVNTRYSVSGIYNPETNMIQVGVSRISRLDYDYRIEGREHAIKRALSSSIYITVPKGANPGKYFKNVCSGFCHIKFVEMQKSLINNQTEQQDEHTSNTRPVERVSQFNELSESQIH